tara:strand:+ start:168 stop:770 length:603 start_codon:yes stop_codon:yes gene_type:complete
MNDDEYNRYILIKDNILSAEVCESIIERFEKNSVKNKQNDRESLHKFIPGDKTFGFVFDQHDEDWIDIFDILNNSVITHIKEYLKRTEYDYIPEKLYFPYCNVQKILEGGFYGLHIDGRVRGQYKTSRVITCIWYLNDVEKGGETSFPKTGFKVKPKTGRLVFFPSNPPFIHEGLPPSETKYIVSCWLEIETSFVNINYA